MPTIMDPKKLKTHLAELQEHRDSQGTTGKKNSEDWLDDFWTNKDQFRKMVTRE